MAIIFITIKNDQNSDFILKNIKICINILNFSNFFENRDLARVAPEKCEYLCIGFMDFESGTEFGFYSDLSYIK
jgi:hypothetical protein